MPIKPLLDIMRAANVPAGPDNEERLGLEGMLIHSFDSSSGAPLDAAQSTLEGWIAQNIAYFFQDAAFQDEPLSERIRLMMWAIEDAVVDLQRVSSALAALAAEVEEDEEKEEDEKEHAAIS